MKLLFRKADGEVARVSAAAAEQGQPEPELQTASVLVIDDDPDVRGFIAAIRAPLLLVRDPGRTGRQTPTRLMRAHYSPSRSTLSANPAPGVSRELAQ